MDLEPQACLLILAVLLSAAAALCDLRTGLIPNLLSGAAACVLLSASLALQLAAHGGGGIAPALLVALLGAIVTLCVPLCLYRLNGIGGGDVKLLGALGVGLGPLAGLELQLYAFALMLLYAPARLLYTGTLWRTLQTTSALLMRPFTRRASRRPLDMAQFTSFRFGPAIFGGALICALQHWSGS
jgi:prepilin peptidase CpaA